MMHACLPVIVGYHAGPILTNAGRAHDHDLRSGGHGARPETTVDPIVIAARTVVRCKPSSRGDVAVRSSCHYVGSIHGGTKNNIIPDEVRLQLTVRSFTDPVRQHLLSAISRIVKAEAEAAGAPREPLIERGPPTQALVNDTALTRRVSAVLIREFGARAKDAPRKWPAKTSRSFSWPVSDAHAPRRRGRAGEVRRGHEIGDSPSLAPFIPVRTRSGATIKTAMLAEVLALRELMPAEQRR